MSVSNFLKSSSFVFVLGAFTWGASGLASSFLCNPPECQERLVSSAGTLINTSDWGSKNQSNQAILLVHGLPHSQKIWERQVVDHRLDRTKLSKKFRVITMDVRGQGASDKPSNPLDYGSTQFASDIEAVLNSYGIDKVILVGHSYGGFVVTDYLFQKGTARVSGVIYTNSAGYVDTINEDLTPAVFALVGDLFSPDDAVLTAALEQFNVLSFAPIIPSRGKLLDLVAVDKLTTIGSRGGLLGKQRDEIDPDPTFQSLVSSGVPVLLLFGAEDEITNVPATFNNLKARIPGSDLITYPGHGHLPMLTNAQRFNKDVLEFAKKAFSRIDYDNSDED